MSHEFDEDKARDNADDGIDRAARNASKRWLHQALRATYRVCRWGVEAGKYEFTTEDIDLVLDRLKVPPPREGRAMGAVMRIAASRGWCVATNRFEKGAEAQSNRRPKQVWRALETMPYWDGKA